MAYYPFDSIHFFIISYFFSVFEWWLAFKFVKFYLWRRGSSCSMEGCPIISRYDSWIDRAACFPINLAGFFVISVFRTRETLRFLSNLFFISLFFRSSTLFAVNCYVIVDRWGFRTGSYKNLRLPKLSLHEPPGTSYIFPWTRMLGLHSVKKNRSPYPPVKLSFSWIVGSQGESDFCHNLKDAILAWRSLVAGLL